MRDSAAAAERTAVRLLRLTSHELRGLGTSLHGHSQHMGHCAAGSAGTAEAVGIAAAAVQILSIADELQNHAVPTGAPRILREETLDLSALLVESIGSTAALLSPGRRNWRLAPALCADLLWSDRRALRHILSRVLIEAARNTRHDDWIDIAVRPHPEGLMLLIEDEGSGLATPDPRAIGADSRGIGLRLTLARSLMEAHGGRLEVEAQASIGTRVTLVFPAARLRRHSPAEQLGG